MKTAISIPDAVFRSAERLARRLGVSRSELYAIAVKRYVEERSRQHRAAEIDAALQELQSEPDPVLSKLSARAIKHNLKDDRW